ncbi:aspartyl protease family protein At5g10770-like [Miscanthus floridulus]|uniref:aspartyl protease family protein At5g10770-like n=1 Tax=Miscanthus floridulus TaxID=154761 RepID=UPI00345ADC9B
MENRLRLSKNDKSPSVDKTKYRSVIGSLRYLVNTRPDIAYAMGIVSRYMEDPKGSHWAAVKQILRYLSGTMNYGCIYKKLNASETKLTGYSDSDLAGDVDDRKSTSGSVFLLGSCLVTWVSQKQRVVALSSCEAEYIASANAACQDHSGHRRQHSYCVPPTPSDAGFFVLGKPPSSRTRTFVATPMLRFTQAPTLYRVLLRGITVAGQRLNVPATVFAAGSVMDSRTAITRLPPTAYQALRAAFRSRMGTYRLAPPKGSLHTCYDFTGVMVVRVPRVALVFDRNAAVELDPSGILLDDCLAFVPNGDDRAPGIIGNVQQQTIEVLYDVGGRSVGFRRGAC